MLFPGKKQKKPAQGREEKSLYPVLHVAGSLKEYQKDLVQKEVASLWELSMVNAAFSNVLKETEHFQVKLQELGSSFSSIDETAGEFAQVRGENAQKVADASGGDQRHPAVYGKDRHHCGPDESAGHQRLH